MSVKPSDLWFLDLEGTIITDWDSMCGLNPILINANTIRRLLELNNVKSINIFSFAIQDNSDQLLFYFELENKLRHALGINIKQVPTMVEMYDIIFNNPVFPFEKVNHLIKLGKAEVFKQYCIAQYKDITVNIIDDEVSTNLIQVDNLNINYINVDKIKVA